MTRGKGYKLTEEHKKKIGDALRGDRHFAWGKTFTKEHRDKLSKARMGVPPWNKGMKGFNAGVNHPRWIVDRSKVKNWDRQHNDPNYKQWRMSVWLRDGFKCKIANPDCSGRIEAHHILGWASHPEIRYEINNGITLCHAHHPRKRAEEKRLAPQFQELVSALKEQ